MMLYALLKSQDILFLSSNFIITSQKCFKKGLRTLGITEQIFDIEIRITGQRMKRATNNNMMVIVANTKNVINIFEV